MKLIHELLKLDSDFIKLADRKIIDAELEIIDKFINQRNTLMTEIEDRFSKNIYTDDEKKEIFNSIKQSSDQVTTKVKNLQQMIKQEKLKLFNSKKLYSTHQTNNSYFIDKMA